MFCQFTSVTKEECVILEVTTNGFCRTMNWRVCNHFWLRRKNHLRVKLELSTTRTWFFDWFHSILIVFTSFASLLGFKNENTPVYKSLHLLNLLVYSNYHSDIVRCQILFFLTCPSIIFPLVIFGQISSFINYNLMTCSFVFSIFCSLIVF